MRIAPAIQLIARERQQLELWARGRRTPARLVLRAKIVLLAAAGHDNHQIAAAVATSRQTVGLWRQRFVTQRTLGLAQDAPRGGACKINCVTGYHASFREAGGCDDQTRHKNGCVAG